MVEVDTPEYQYGPDILLNQVGRYLLTGWLGNLIWYLLMNYDNSNYFRVERIRGGIHYDLKTLDLTRQIWSPQLRT